MLTNFLLDHQWLTPAALVLLVVLGPVLGSGVARRPRLAWALVGASLVPLALLTLLPQDRQLFGRCELTLDDWVWPTPSRVELFANLVLFVAPVLLAAVATRRPWFAFAAGVAVSAGIEAVQAAVPAIGRSCDSGDWISNAMGAFIGATLGWVALRAAARHARLDREHDLADGAASLE